MNFKSYLEAVGEGGSKAGNLEVTKISLEEAKEYALRVFKEEGLDLYKELPDFDKNFLHAKEHAKKGHTKRKDMPVITSRDVDLFKDRLQQGYIDINPPKSRIKIKKTPFPEGLQGEQAKQWLKNGLKLYDDSETDDKIKVKLVSVRVSDLTGIQEQMYFDKVMLKRAKEGNQESTNFIRSSYFICSSDLVIIDGNHRWLSGMLNSPDMKVNIMMIDLPMKTLLPLTLAYSDAIGNKRNK